jgi:hypothetical protein
MTDAKFERLMMKLSKAQTDYHNLKIAAEEEFERRYGANPSDADCDPWIDAFHVSVGPNAVSIHAVDEMAAYSGLSRQNA